MLLLIFDFALRVHQLPINFFSESSIIFQFFITDFIDIFFRFPAILRFFSVKKKKIYHASFNRNEKIFFAISPHDNKQNKTGQKKRFSKVTAPWCSPNFTCVHACICARGWLTARSIITHLNLEFLAPPFVQPVHSAYFIFRLFRLFFLFYFFHIKRNNTTSFFCCRSVRYIRIFFFFFLRRDIERARSRGK